MNIKMSLRKNVIPVLILAHFLGGIVAAFFSANQPAISSSIFFAVIFCQTSLLGMWGGLGATHWVLRMLGLGVGTIYLALELGIGIDGLGSEVFLLVTLATFVVALVTWIVRLVKAAIIRRIDMIPTESNDDIALTITNERLQFSIRQLMIFTFIVACLTAIGKFLAPYVPGLDTMAQLSVLALCFVAVALTSIWAILGYGHPAFRSVFVVAIAVATGIVGGYVNNDVAEIIFWVSTTVLQAGLLLGSLWIVRLGDYRIAAKIPLAG